VKKTKKEIIGIVGLGYVGLPLAAAFATKFRVIGFDIKPDRIRALKAGRDETGEAEPAHLKNPRLTFTSDPNALRRCTFIVIAVPTPIDESREPDLTPLE